MGSIRTCDIPKWRAQTKTTKSIAQPYNTKALKKNKRILCIGDNLNTDIRGSNIQSFDSLLISNGIHKKEIETNNFENILKKYEVNVNFIQSNLSW